MKRVVFVTAMAVLSVGVLQGPVGAEDPKDPKMAALPTEAKPAAKPDDVASDRIALAGRLIESARAQKSAVLMVGAVQLLRGVTVSDSGGPLGDKMTKAGTGKGKKETARPPTFDTKALLAEARQLAGSDPALVALVDSEAAKKSDAEGTEKLTGGPSCKDFSIDAGDVGFLPFHVIPRTWQQIGVVSDGGCDIDCYAIDQAGKLFKGDDSVSANCYIKFYSTYGGQFHVAIDNRYCDEYALFRVCGD